MNLIQLTASEITSLFEKIAKELSFTDKFYLLNRTQDILVKLMDDWGVEAMCHNYIIDPEAYIQQFFLQPWDKTRPVSLSGGDALMFRTEIVPTVILECMGDLNILEKYKIDQKPKLYLERADIVQALSKQSVFADA